MPGHTSHRPNEGKRPTSWAARLPILPHVHAFQTAIAHYGDGPGMDRKIHPKCIVVKSVPRGFGLFPLNLGPLMPEWGGGIRWIPKGNALRHGEVPRRATFLPWTPLQPGMVLRWLISRNWVQPDRRACFFYACVGPLPIPGTTAYGKRGLFLWTSPAVLGSTGSNQGAFRVPSFLVRIEFLRGRPTGNDPKTVRSTRPSEAPVLCKSPAQISRNYVLWLPDF